MSDTPQTAGRALRSRLALVLTLVLFAAALAAWVAVRQQGRAGRAAAEAPSPAPAPGATYGVLLGKWMRADGGYMVHVRGVKPDGAVDALYFNPSPIHVEKAAASREEGRTRLFIELRDVNYPGCTYQLAYDPQTGRLQGEYFQAALQERYAVEFVRMEE